MNFVNQIKEFQRDCVRGKAEIRSAILKLIIGLARTFNE